MQTTGHGQPRRVGVELELTGLELDELAGLVAEQFGLSCAVTGRYERVLDGDPAGPWGVELDSEMLKRNAAREHVDAGLLDELRDSAEELLASIVSAFAPLEVVSPPLPMARLGEVERLIVRLRDAGAKGTSDGIAYAFAMQFNPEVPSEDAATITAYLKAFQALYPWLHERAHVNPTRKFASMAEPYPIDYVRLLVDPGYQPDLATLIDDYLAHNASRNRALDVLPLFLHLDPGRVRAVTDDPRIKPRPTFHYRLPNCEIHLPEWTLSAAWEDWLEVEALAHDPARLEACCSAYAAFLDKPLNRWFGQWAKEVSTQWLAR